jgi:hypothetical protein
MCLSSHASYCLCQAHGPRLRPWLGRSHRLGIKSDDALTPLLIPLSVLKLDGVTSLLILERSQTGRKFGRVVVTIGVNHCVVDYFWVDIVLQQLHSIVTAS